MLGGGVLLQRFGDLIKGRRTNERRLEKSFTKPTLSATPGDLSLVLPKRHLDNIIEMIYALDKVAPGMANADTLLYGVEVKFTVRVWNLMISWKRRSRTCSPSATVPVSPGCHRPVRAESMLPARSARGYAEERINFMMNGAKS